MHPTILAQEGLPGALDALAARTPLPVTVQTSLSGRLSPEVEATAYFVACEALTNAVKHGRATQATISATLPDGVLVVEVEDDGVGGAEPLNGSGLRGLADRVEAQGGRLTVESPAGGGTRVVGEIPCES